VSSLHGSPLSTGARFRTTPIRNLADGYHQIQVTPPTFDVQTLEVVDWKSLPSQLMYEILSFPNFIEAASHRIDAAFEYAASPPISAKASRNASINTQPWVSRSRGLPPSFALPTAFLPGTPVTKWSFSCPSGGRLYFDEAIDNRAHAPRHGQRFQGQWQPQGYPVHTVIEDPQDSSACLSFGARLSLPCQVPAFSVGVTTPAHCKIARSLHWSTHRAASGSAS
jgi:hypothetical protein